MVLRVRGLVAGAVITAVLSVASSSQKLTAASGERIISLYNIHTKETVTALFKKNGKYVESGLQQVNHVLRDFRRNEETKMDPELIDLLWEVHNELGSKEPIHIISGFRSRATNEMLRKTVGGQASESRHILGKAADVHFPDVPLKNIRYSALIRERGGVGYYPTSAIPFVHLDTDRVRSWPRLPRAELALLFPNGSTRHMPADGGPITRDDVRTAQVKYHDLAVQIAAFQQERLAPKVPVAIAAAGSSQPNPTASSFAPARRQVAALTAEPRLLEPQRAFESAPTDKTPRPVASPSAADRARLTELVAFSGSAPQLVAGPAPARRPAALASAMPSLTGNAGPTLDLAPKAPVPPAPRVASADMAMTYDPPQLSDGRRFAWSAAWSPAPAYDEEHPDELSYRPFPIAPYLTQSANEPLMAELLPHDAARTVDLIDQPGSALPLRFLPGEQAARLLWAQEFTGDAVRPTEKLTPTGDDVKSRVVKTSQR